MISLLLIVVGTIVLFELTINNIYIIVSWNDKSAGITNFRK